MKKAIGIVIVLLLIGLGLFFYFKTKEVSNKIFVKSAATNTSQLDNLQEKFTAQKPFNILMLGYGGGNHDGTYLTDSIIVAHVDPKIKTVTLISIPRDLWVKLPFQGISDQKINTAYQIGMDDQNYPNKPDQYKGEAGAGALAKKTVEQVVGMPIDNFVAIDFNGFTNTINTLGGVDITVEKAFDDYEYPIEGKEKESCGHSDEEIASISAELATGSATMDESDIFPCRYEHLHFDRGEQHMDGTRALKYTRSRHSLQDGTDFGRSKRQQNLLIAVKQRVFDIGFITKVIPFMTSLGDDFRTDMAISDVEFFLKQATVFKNYSIKNLALTDQNYLKDTFSDDKQSILVPRSGVGQWDQIHNWIASSLDPNHVVTAPVIQVENGTKTPGLALSVTNVLQAKNYTVLAPDTADKTTYLTTKITVTSNVDKKIISTLKTEFNAQVVMDKSNTNLPYDLLIVLGKDYSDLQSKITPTTTAKK